MTRTRAESAQPTEASITSHPSLDRSRFVPGSVLNKRYRIVGLLGRGGMGEVYRADDLKLGQPVALKFLPREVESDERRRQRFLNEVRLALRITHPNVCRVHDIGEVEGQHFISMEYVDGEDLASLLRRIGRLPQERAVEIARQLCAGLAAAHDEGILHRDLKPANIMIDGRGRARITDFGLADLSGTVEGEEVRAGTPSYMAPEQLAGSGVTERSDIYALGLVLYEIFTGKPAFKARTVAEMARMQQSTPPTDPTSLVRELDPTIESVVLRALEPDPARRPQSALAVSAALPGGDPLAAALAAGETPSPEMVAAAGERGGMAPGWVALCLVLIVGGLLTCGLVRPRRDVLSLIETPYSIAALRERARLMVERLGFDEPPVATAHGLTTLDEYIGWLRDDERAAEMRARVAAGWPPVYALWYRESPEKMVPVQVDTFGTSPGDPPLTVPEMLRVLIDPQGRLVRLEAMPPERDADSVAGGAESRGGGGGATGAPAGSADAAGSRGGDGTMGDPANSADARRSGGGATGHSADSAGGDGSGGNGADEPASRRDPDALWSQLFEEAGLDPERFVPVPPSYRPAFFADARAAWEGTVEQAPDTTLRVEAAAVAGRPVSFCIVGPWARDRARPEPPSIAERIMPPILITVFLSLLAGLAVLARRCLYQGRSDLKGATRVAVYIFGVELVGVLLGYRHLFRGEPPRFFPQLAFIVFLSTMIFLAYVALEPYVRRLWPTALISWTRLLGGRLRDPLVGRDLLLGAAFGVATGMLDAIHVLVPPLLGLPEEPLGSGAQYQAISVATTLANTLDRFAGSVGTPMMMLVLLVLLRLLLRNTKVMIGVYFVLAVAIRTLGSPHPALDVMLHVVVMALTLYVVLQIGLVAAFAMWLFHWGSQSITTLDPSSWVWTDAVISGVVLLTLAAYAAITALGGRALLQEEV